MRRSTSPCWVPFGGGPPSHHHDSYDEAFYVLSGEMEFRVDGATARLRSPDAMQALFAEHDSHVDGPPLS